MSIATIVCGAPEGEFSAELAEGLIIAADCGLDYCLRAGVVPDVAVGDFDSAHSAVPAGVECVRVSPIKDDTDAFLAAETAIERGCNRLRFLCALGGRLDHSMANVQMLERLHMMGVSAELRGRGERAYLLHGGESAEIKRFAGYVSVFSYGGQTQVTLRGMKYPLERFTLTNAYPLGVSNEVSAELAQIEVHSGTALVIEVKTE